MNVNRLERQLAQFVKPRNPLPTPKVALPDELSNLKNIEQLSELISQLKSDRKGAPVLLRQYLKLGGQLLGFNVDREFNDTLDGLIMVHLLRTPPRTLARYMGKEQARRSLAYHRAHKQPMTRAS